MENSELQKSTSDELFGRSFILTMLAIIIPSIIVICYLLGVYEKRQLENNTTAELARYSDSLVGQQLLTVRYVLDGLAANKDILKLAEKQGGQPMQLEKYLTGVAAGSGASIVYVMDKAGTVIGCSRYGDNKTLLGKNYSFRKYFIGAMEGKGVVFPAVGVTTNKRGFYFSTPIYLDADKTVIEGVVVIKIGVQRIEGVLGSMDFPSGMVTPSGIVFISNNDEFLFKISRDISNQELNEIVQSRQFGSKVLERLPGMGNKPSTNGIYTYDNGIVKKIELLFPGWYLAQWRKFRYPYEKAFFISLLTAVFISFSGMLIVARRNRRLQELELQVAKESAEKNLRKGYETLRRILKSSPVAVFVCDEENKISWLNKTGLDMLSLSSYDEAKDYVFGQKIDVIDETESSLVSDNPEDKILNVEAMFKVETGVEVPVLCNRTSFFRGEEELFLYSFLDLSERKQMEAELVHTRKMESIGQLAAGIAHEINTPSQFVASNLDFIIESLPDIFAMIGDFESLCVDRDATEEAVKEKIEEIKDEADYEYLVEELPSAAQQSREGIERISKIVLAMKAFSHPGDNNTMQPADINNALETTLTVAANEWKSIADIDLDLAPGLPAVTCLIGELNQVFLNLIVNGAHSIEDKQKMQDEFEKGVLRITTAQKDDFVEISISDTGMGIPQDFRDKIFDPFFTTKEVGKGSGQGLYIARTLIHEQHGGTLTFATKSGEGTTFTISLPVTQEGEEQQALS